LSPLFKLLGAHRLSCARAVVNFLLSRIRLRLHSGSWQSL